MNKDFVFASIIGVCTLLTLAFIAHSFLKGGNSKATADETVLNEVVTEPFEAVKETVSDEIAATQPVDIEAAVPAPTKPECVLIEDFADGSSQLSWFVVNDGVMGGLSTGAVSIEPDVLVHTGVINTNGGGFSSVRARLLENNLVGYTRLQIRLNTFGRQYALNFGDNRYRSVSHRALLPASPGDVWQEVTIEFDQTAPTQIGFRVDAEPFVASAINELSLILADGADGSFKMEVAWIQVCL